MLGVWENLKNTSKNSKNHLNIFNNAFIRSIFLIKVFSLKIFLRKSLIKCFFIKHYKWFFNFLKIFSKIYQNA